MGHGFLNIGLRLYFKRALWTGIRWESPLVKVEKVRGANGDLIRRTAPEVLLLLRINSHYDFVNRFGCKDTGHYKYIAIHKNRLVIIPQHEINDTR